MTLIQLYQSMPIWAQHAIVSAYGVRLRRLRYGPSFDAESKILSRIDAKGERESLEFQRRQLTRVVSAAFRYVPHYRDMAARLRIGAHEVTHETISELPILTKDELRADPRRFLSEAVPISRRQTIFTSGTTGSPLEVVCTASAIQKNYAHFARFLSWHGVSPMARSATFAGRPLVPIAQREPPFWRHNFALRNVQYSSYHLSRSNAPAYLAHLSAYAPEFIDSYPSSIYFLARFALEIGWSPPDSLKVIVTSSESLDSRHRTAIETAFCCPVRDQYGSAEMVAFVAECDRGRYHVDSEYGLVELIPDSATAEEQAGANIVATGFINPVMPLIRYQTGDRAVSCHDRCACGRSGQVVAKILGREDDIIRSPAGALIGRLDPVFKGTSGIVECQIEQVRLDTLILRAVLAPGHTSASLDPVIENLRLRWSPVGRIETQIVDRIPRGANGKLRSCVGMRDFAEPEKIP